MTERLTARELRRINQELAKYGLRICSKHQGDPLPLTDEHFYHQNQINPPFRSDCKQCCNAASLDWWTRRYHTDAAFAARMRQQSARRRVKQKRQQLIQVLSSIEERTR